MFSRVRAISQKSGEKRRKGTRSLVLSLFIFYFFIAGESEHYEVWKEVSFSCGSLITHLHLMWGETYTETRGPSPIAQSLPRNQVPEWAASYINYKGLKKLVKALAEKARTGDTVDTAGGLLLPFEITLFMR